MSSGGASGADEFDIMADESDKVSAKAMDGIIESITSPQKVAINHEWLKNKHFYPTHAMDLEEAYGNIMRLADKRGLY
jgi:hypothetical protein